MTDAQEEAKIPNLLTAFGAIFFFGSMGLGFLIVSTFVAGGEFGLWKILLTVILAGTGIGCLLMSLACVFRFILAVVRQVKTD